MKVKLKQNNPGIMVNTNISWMSYGSTMIKQLFKN